MSSSSATRIRREEDVQKAYDIQVQAGLEGAARFTAVGVGLSIVAHYSWPAFRVKCVIPVCVAGVVFGAERALIAHEAQRRLEENNIRRVARFELTKQGIVPTETEIAKWREVNERQD
ncbi:hypothetical protein HHX47_DHR5000396 [Lentinula edodes]|nr:hypothetical protein HHX47_DHR5000396 [Lentinula edodes]